MKQILKTETAPGAIGPYSQGVMSNGFLFLSGQIALAPDGSSKTAESIEIQTEQVMQNISALLKAAGRDFCDILKTTIFLTNMSDFNAVNEIYGKYFTENPPARSTVAVAELPKGALVEIECISG